MGKTIGNLTINGHVQTKVNSNHTVYNVLPSKSRVYVTHSDFKTVTVYGKSEGKICSYTTQRSWYNDDNDVHKLMYNGSSQPTPFTVFTKDGQDYLFGLLHDEAQISIWKINNSTFKLENRVNIKSPVIGYYYCRAGWNGKNKIYFTSWSGIQGISNTLFMFDINTQEITLISNTLGNVAGENIAYSFGASYTGNGLIVDDNYLYISSGSNNDYGVIVCYDIKNLKMVEVVKTKEIASAFGTSDMVNGSMVLDLVDNYAYVFNGTNNIWCFSISGLKQEKVSRCIRLSDVIAIGNNGKCSPYLKDFSDYIKVTKELVPIGALISHRLKFDGEARFDSNYEYVSGGYMYKNSVPSVPTIINIDNGIVRVGEKVTVSVGGSVDSDDDKVTYDLDLFNGTSWIKIAPSFSTNKINHIMPSMPDTSQAKYRVRAFDGTDYSLGYKESSVFTVYNNTPPSNPSAFITPTSGQVVKPLQTVKVNWGNSVDTDKDDKVTYELSFFDGSKWNILGFNLASTTFNHLIPKIRGTKVAKYKVRAYDTKDYSEYTESNLFEILDVDLSTLATPNALKLDGTDDKISLGSNPCTSFNKQLTLGFNKIKLDKSDSEYPIITKMCGEGKPSYALYVTPEGHLKLSYSHASKNNDSVETTIDCTGKWGIVEAFIDTDKGTMGIKLDGIVVASKDIPKGEDIIVPTNESTYIGFDFTTQKYGKFLVSGIGLFNKNLSEEESKAFREVEPTGKEAGLVVCYPLKEGGSGATLNDISPSNNEATMFGGIEWGFQFSVVTDIKTPYPYLPQTRENLEYLRYKIDEFRHSNGLTPIKWTDSILREDITPIKAIHWNEARKAIVEVYDKMGQKFANKSTEEELRDTIQPHSTKYEIRNLPNVIDNIILGLKNK